MAAERTYVVERRRHVAAPPGAVRDQLVDFRRWRSWSPWEEVDPELHRTYGGAESGVGARYAWAGNRKAGKGRMEIEEVDDGRVVVDLQFLAPFRSRSTTEFLLEPDDSGTTVTWRMTGPLTWQTRVMGLFASMDKLIGPDVEKGLDRLAAEVEGQQRPVEGAGNA
jgi:hypothetical protein